MAAARRILSSRNCLTDCGQIVYKIGVKPQDRDEVHSTLYRHLLQQIISGVLAPGQRLVEEDLARAYHVSRTPIREVLLAFQKDGLVQRERNRGARVVSFTADDVEELFDLRKALEVHSVRKAVRTTKLNELLALEQRILALEGGAGKAWSEQQAAIDFALHHLIVANSGNRRLIACMKNLSLLVESLQLASFGNEEHVREAGMQHLAVVRALLASDAELAQKLLGDHIESGKRNAIELFLQARLETAVAVETTA